MLQQRENNFDFIRFCAATCVLVGHSYDTGGKGSFMQSLCLQFFGVIAFFGISGYLISWSYERRSDLCAFTRNRLLRIYPAFLVLLALGAFLAGPLLTRLSLRDYFLHSNLWASLLSDVLMMPFDGHVLNQLFPQMPFTLPGVFENRPIPSFFGSVWTLPIELRCYVLIGVLGVLKCLNTRAMLIILLPLCLLYLPVQPETLAFMYAKTVILYYISFVSGSLIYLHRARLVFDERLHVPLCAVFTAGWLLSTRSPFHPPDGWVSNLADLCTTGSYLCLIIRFAFLKIDRLGSFSKRGDYSYGLYLYAWPIQQIYFTKPGGNVLIATIVCFVLAFVCAALSWHLVEKRALARKRS